VSVTADGESRVELIIVESVFLFGAIFSIFCDDAYYVF